MNTHENPGVYNNFTFPCKTCGAIIQVEESAEQPHACRIEIR